jgi:hypothetical protein
MTTYEDLLEKLLAHSRLLMHKKLTKIEKRVLCQKLYATLREAIPLIAHGDALDKQAYLEGLNALASTCWWHYHTLLKKLKTLGITLPEKTDILDDNQAW